MEHEVLVPLAPQAVRRSLRRPELLARCLPGFVPAEEADPDGGVLAGRLKLRVGNSSITYRGTLRAVPGTGSPAGSDADADPVLFTVEAEQAVGEGDAAGTVKVTVLPLDGGEGDERSRILFDCALTGKGRIEELDPAALELAGRRLLDRFCATFVVELDLEAPEDPQLFEELDGLPDLGDLGEFPDLADLSDLTELPDIDSPTCS